MRCPACAEDDLRPFCDVGRVPVFCNVLFDTAAEARAAAMGDMRLGVCPRCGLIYNVDFDPELVRYSPRYENSLHFSPHFQAWAEGLARDLVQRHGLAGRDVMEIGCGKGDFLGLLCAAGAARGIGFDASYEPERGGGPPPGVSIIRDHYGPAYGDRTGDLICSRHVLEHIARPRELLAVARDAARRRPGAVVYFEVPNALYTIEDLGIWDLIYEHCSYFAPVALAALFQRAELRATRVYAEYGNQFLCIEAVQESGSDGSVAKLPGPDVAGLVAAAERFAEHRRAKIESWRRRLEELRAGGARVAIWGAGSKGVTFANVFPGLVQALIDINPHKRGRYAPCVALPVSAPEELPGLDVDVVLVMNPVYEQEIGRQIAAAGGRARTEVV